MLFSIHTYGCQMNVRDSESVSAILQAAGHSQAASEAEADLIIVNSCSVRGKAEDKALGKLGLLCAAKRDRPGLIVGVMGCMAQRLGPEIFKRVPALDFAVGTRRCGAIPRMVRRALAGETGICEISDLLETPDVPDAHDGTACTAFVTILLGCERRCSYCIVPDVRGAEYSRPAAEIVAEITALARGGVREVTLLGQSVMRYGLKNPVSHDTDTPDRHGLTEPFARLLEAVANIPGIARVRFTSSHPSGCTDQLIQAMRSLPQVCRHLHLPCQSGSDRILKAMRRGYTRAGYLDATRRLREAMPDIAVTTDVIVGFPGETESDFQDTRSLMEAAGFDNAFIFKYSPRPGTPAAALPDDVPAAEKMRRNRVLLADQDLRGALINQRLVGTVQEVLAEGPSLRNASRWSGRSSGNKIVVFEPDPALEPGALVNVRVTRAAPQTLYGELVL
ncbi:MAG: tRNA (N6-isopentenyl adenosine(37)-C2)-methylthiotransferase MiaB [Kiritimatiellae bacterium]|nr:tRNA (N6-isopentenyl adenosine(37)-C2)-methylthiotransferase MiaB [Kiritimatiellia bacterium]MDD4621962.1 tRNA (N6-isopentenyl adenosine(37)-C2)-methylthiotransferase MiaB [Kiritimatiellia bacterium]